jgi:hypothetical protein
MKTKCLLDDVSLFRHLRERFKWVSSFVRAANMITPLSAQLSYVLRERTRDGRGRFSAWRVLCVSLEFAARISRRSVCPSERLAFEVEKGISRKKPQDGAG